MAREYRPIPELSKKQIDRFWSKVDKREPDECWEWKAGRNQEGYGQISIRDISWRANRVAYRLATEVDPGKLLVRHTCDNPPCVNPAHLLLGTQRENAADAIERGRHTHGETMGLSVLTAEQVVEMRALYATGEFSSDEIARKYNVSGGTARRAIRGASWKHLPGALPGFRGRRSRSGRWELDADRVREIRRLFAQGTSRRALAKQFRVTPCAIAKIVAGAAWRDVA